MRYSLNSEDIHEANSNAISLWAYVPPYFPTLFIILTAFVLFIHLVNDRTKISRSENYSLGKF